MLTGSLFFGTGGGGSPLEAQEIYESLSDKKPIQVTSLTDFKPTDVFITAFGVGSITAAGNPQQAIKKAVSTLQNYLNTPIAGIIPVEIGPKALATAFLLASELNIPIVDADFVGGRSAPEVFLETITLFSIKRTPAVVINQNLDTALLLSANNYTFEEVFMRNFAIQSNNQALVVGYPVTKKQINLAISIGTVSDAANVGKLLLESSFSSVLDYTKGKLLVSGKITAITNNTTPGFTTNTVEIKTNNNKTAIIFQKNENLIFWLDEKPVLTCPDLIIILDKNGRPLYNLDLKVNTEIIVIGCPAVPLWKTQRGLELFNPRLFGFSFSNKTLKELL